MDAVKKAEHSLQQAGILSLMSPAVRAQHLVHLAEMLSEKAAWEEEEPLPAGQDVNHTASDLYFRALALWEHSRAMHPPVCSAVSLLLSQHFGPGL